MNKIIEAKVLLQEERNLQLEIGKEIIQCILAEGERPVDIGKKYPFFVWQAANQNLYASRRLPETSFPQFSVLEVLGLHPKGYMVDWDRKPSLIAESEDELMVGRDYVFYIYQNDNDSLVASANYRDFIKDHETELKKNQQVEVLLYTETDLGVKCIVNNKYEGLIYHDQIFEDYYRGEIRKAYVQKVREDGKLDIIFQQNNSNIRDVNAKAIVEYLQENGGSMPYTDKSSPDDISEIFGMSKKAFKRALGNLYKDKIVRLESQKTILIHGKRN
jgi:predicted RNA-binding protein (virulence factor B family)